MQSDPDAGRAGEAPRTPVAARRGAEGRRGRARCPERTRALNHAASPSTSTRRAPGARSHAPAGAPAWPRAPFPQVTVSYGEIVNFMVRLGAAYADPSNYFGVAFKELSWGGVPTESFGSPQFTITYNGNGAASGAAPAPFTGPEGAPVAAAANPFSRPGYDFTGWNTKADGSGAALAAGGATFVPYLGETLFAQWAPSPLAAANDAYIGRYNAPLVVALPGSVLANDGPSSHPLSVAQIVAGVPAAKGTLVVNMTTGEFVFTPARGFRGNTTFTYSEPGSRRGRGKGGACRWDPPRQGRWSLGAGAPSWERRCVSDRAGLPAR